MQVHGDNMVAARHSEHVCDQLGRNGGAGFVLLVHPGVGEAWDDGRYPTRGRALAGRDEDEELHEVIVNVAASGLDDEDILVADGLGDLDVDFAIGELLDCARRERHIESSKAV